MMSGLRSCGLPTLCLSEARMGSVLRIHWEIEQILDLVKGGQAILEQGRQTFFEKILELHITGVK